MVEVGQMLQIRSPVDAARGERRIQMRDFIDPASGGAVRQVVPVDGLGLTQVDPRLEQRRAELSKDFRK